MYLVEYDWIYLVVQSCVFICLLYFACSKFRVDFLNWQVWIDAGLLKFFLLLSAFVTIQLSFCYLVYVSL